MLVSVVIPTYNRRPILHKCLLALENQKLPAFINNFEIVVVDDGSTDGTREWLQNESRLFPHVVLVQQEHSGPAKGRNLGVENSKGEVIVFIDSDLVVTETFLESHISSLLNSWKKNRSRLAYT